LELLIDSIPFHDIIGLCETNITEKEGKFLNKQVLNPLNYQAFWSKTNEKKKNKGRGVALIIKKLLGYSHNES